MSVRLLIFSLVGVLAAPTLARAERLVVRASGLDASLRASFEEELAVELGPRGIEVDSAESSAPSRSADYEVDVDGGAVRVHCARTDRTVETPVPDGSDARTLALVAATLMSEAAESAPVVAEPALASEAAADGVELSPRVAGELGSPAVPLDAESPAAAAHGPAPEGESSAEEFEDPSISADRSGAAIAARLRRGMGFYAGFGSVGNLSYEERGAVMPGAGIRAVAGLRLLDEFRVGISGTVGFFVQDGPPGLGASAGLRTETRATFEATGTFFVEDASVHSGFRCGGYFAEYAYEDLSSLITVDWLVGFSIGTYLAVSFEVGDGVNVWFRLDADFIVPNAHSGLPFLGNPRNVAIQNGLSSMIVFE